MQQEQFERSFSREKHAAGAWRTTAFSATNPIVRWCATAVSFKHRELDNLARRCRTFSTVLDFGCGNGAYASFFLSRCSGTVIAVDWAPEALRSIARPHRGKLLAVCADVHLLPFKSSSFDALFSIDTLGHLRSQERALDEINRVCRSAAPLFIHSECADYRTRIPDRRLIAKTGYDPIGAVDGHTAIRRANEMRALYEQRFMLRTFYSPAGWFGWLLGYPEKYFAPFLKARMYGFAALCGAALLLRKVPGIKTVFRIVNMATNLFELFLGLEGGGSCFARCRCVIPLAHGAVPGGSLPSVDVVVATWRREESLRRAVDSITGQLAGGDFVYVVHQGCGEPPLFGDSRIRVLHQPYPNLPAARNVGLAAGGNPLVLFIDDDCTALPGLLDAHRRAYVDEGVGVVAGYIDDPIFPIDSHAPSWFDITTGELVQHFARPHSGTAISAMGANMSFRRDVLDAIGGFDMQYRSNALWEEIDTSFRVQNAGFSIRYAANAQVKHHRLGAGGCRVDARGAELFHTFANTAYFAATFAPRPYLRTWLRFWKYRLEYYTRKQVAGGTADRIRHDPRLVAAGIAGAAVGCIRFLIHGCRRALPRAVVEHYRNGQRSCT